MFWYSIFINGSVIYLQIKSNGTPAGCLITRGLILETNKSKLPYRYIVTVRDMKVHTWCAMPHPVRTVLSLFCYCMPLSSPRLARCWLLPICTKICLRKLGGERWCNWLFIQLPGLGVQYEMVQKWSECLTSGVLWSIWTLGCHGLESVLECSVKAYSSLFMTAVSCLGLHRPCQDNFPLSLDDFVSLSGDFVPLLVLLDFPW